MGGAERSDWDLTPCHYCGLIADTIDHVVARSYLDRADRDEIPRRVMEVPACRECNSGLTNRYHETLADRKRAAKERIRRKYAHYLRIPPWTDAELSELGPLHRARVESGLRMKAVVKDRLAW